MNTQLRIAFVLAFNVIGGAALAASKYLLWVAGGTPALRHQ
jgi:hypothetical protein